jgi:hypothetical protein
MDQMSMKRIIRLGLAAAFILATGLCIFSWPHMVQAEYGETDSWGYSQWWNSDYNSRRADYAPWQSPMSSYSSQWPGYDPASNQSFVTYRPGDNIFGLLSQGSSVYIPPNEVKLLDQSFLEANAKLTVSPSPDTVIRVIFHFRPLDENKIMEALVIETPERKGFVVFEWGGILGE